MKFDIIVIGAGIVGLATALKIKAKNPALKLLLIDKENKLAAHQTGHNSGVIHSGLYYKPGSLKATNCINGYHQLVSFCDKHEIPYELCGKIVVATSKEEIPLMHNLYKRGQENGLENLILLNQEQLKVYEPHVNGLEGIFVPQTGIVDYKQVAARYAELIQEKEGAIHLGEKVTEINTGNHECSVVTNKSSYSCKLVVNCSGLYSDKVAQFTHQKLNVKIIPFRGEYYKLTPEKEYLVKNLIYPVPDPNFPFLGVHFTRMIGGGIEAGPNAVLAFRREGYTKRDIHLAELGESLAWPGFQKVAMKYWKTGMGEMYRSFSKAAFTKALQKLMPEIREQDLSPGGAGVRAQACDRNGGLIDDFLILENEYAVNVCNAPSPAATSSLSIGDTVSDLALKRF
ncbi:L-2-hydroxyglutarate oxidase [Fulvivirga imtechensis AK7]|uniref:L-2-hydroxyglutarate oxidase n=1 Tax=Fulvivirga imtechensis AK7 TaxID=1237149 RepID=L8K1F0_9BACT|nr:L-2-hydroxyglutarate oxidase [Fulvivirga imtechensis]ELR73739.1 L-2-hydroxyglutarate oxidase [Fulvivirga imtechensis AK7]